MELQRVLQVELQRVLAISCNAGDSGECNAAVSTTLNGLSQHLGLSSDTILDGLPVFAPINVVTALLFCYFCYL